MASMASTPQPHASSPYPRVRCLRARLALALDAAARARAGGAGRLRPQRGTGGVACGVWHPKRLRWGACEGTNFHANVAEFDVLTTLY